TPGAVERITIVDHSNEVLPGHVIRWPLQDPHTRGRAAIDADDRKALPRGEMLEVRVERTRCMRGPHRIHTLSIVLLEPLGKSFPVLCPRQRWVEGLHWSLR